MNSSELRPPCPPAWAVVRGGMAALLCLLLWAAPAHATRLVRVFEMDVEGSSPATLQQALRQVLVRATGQRDAASDPALAGLLQDAPRYVQSTSRGAHGETRVVFDAAAITRAIQAAGRPLWDAQRPFTLVVLDPAPPRGSEPAMHAELERTGVARGLGISIVPLPLAGEDGAPLGPGALLQSAQRFGADQLLVGRSESAGGEGPWRWTLYSATGNPSWSGSLAQGIDGAVDRLAPVASSSAAAPDQELRVRVGRVATLKDYANVSRLFSSLPGVRNARLAAAEGDQLEFALSVRGGAEALSAALAGGHLQHRSGPGDLDFDYRP